MISKREKHLNLMLLFGPATLQVICLAVNILHVEAWSAYGQNNQLMKYAWLEDLSSLSLLLTPLLCIIIQISGYIALRKTAPSKATQSLAIGFVPSIVLGFFAFVVKASLG